MSTEEDDDDDIVDSDAVETAESEAPPARDDSAEPPSLEARRKLRDQMQSDIEAFLRSGGRIVQVAANVSAQDTAKISIDNS
jgi:hypothetical protein